MFDEFNRQCKLGVDLVRAKISTYFRKLQIRQAYAPAQAIIPLVTIAILLIFGAGATVFAAVHIVNQLTPEKTKAVSKKTAPDSLESQEPQDSYIVPFPAIPGQEKMKFLIVADKYDRVIHLLKNQRGTWGVIKSYPVAIGANEGRKVMSGDKKTPEGLYFIIGRKEKNELNEIYGPLAYVLNYPNEKDRAEGRTGQGIWIHGTEPGKVPVDTRGCLELHNNNLEKLSRYIKAGTYIPVIIHSNPEFDFLKDINLETIWAERTAVESSKIAIASSNDIAEGDTTTPVKVAQVDSPKVVIATIDSAKPRETTVAVKEEPKPKPEASATKPKPIPTTSKPDAAIKAQIEKWRSNWEQENMSAYQSCYDTTRFKSDDYNWKSWKEKKIRTFKNYEKISVEVSGIKITVESDSTATALFRQKYQSDQFKSESGKRLSLKKSGGNWKIVQEVSATYKE